ncbi:ribosome hibernation-promoting factor, HPF/YfiA family [Bacteroidota bacterium]
MNITITARHFKAHDSLKEYIDEEVSSLSRFNDDIISADVILSYQNVNNSIKKADITVHIPGQVLKSAEDSDDFKKAISVSVEKITRQLKTLKSKRTTY